MPVGICKLCLKEKELQDSHLLGRAVYKVIREEGEDPVVMTPDLIVSTSRQVRAHLLCSDCEQRFSKNGEQYFSSVMARKDKFVLLDLLQAVEPIEKQTDHVVYSGLGARIDTNKLAYYALSVLWRSGVHQWPTLGRQTTSVELVSHSEEIRRYLLEEVPFPADIVEVVTVCSDKASQFLAFTPSRYDMDSWVRYAMLVRGVYFRTMLGATDNFKGICCVHSAPRKIFLADCWKHSKASFASLHKNAKVARNIKQR